MTVEERGATLQQMKTSRRERLATETAEVRLQQTRDRLTAETVVKETSEAVADQEGGRPGCNMTREQQGAVSTGGTWPLHLPLIQQHSVPSQYYFQLRRHSCLKSTYLTPYLIYSSI